MSCLNGRLEKDLILQNLVVCSNLAAKKITARQVIVQNGPDLVKTESNDQTVDTSGTPVSVTSSNINAQGAGPGIAIIDHTHALDTTGVTPAKYENTKVTVDNKGRIVQAENNIVLGTYNSTTPINIPDAGSGFVSIGAITVQTTNARVVYSVTFNVTNTAGTLRTVGILPVLDNVIQTVLWNPFISPGDSLTINLSIDDTSAPALKTYEFTCGGFGGAGLVVSQVTMLVMQQ